jgi:O-antigen biosynthesis protein WbqP
MARRTADFLIALILLALMAIPCLLIGVLIRLTSKGPAIYWSDRVGMGNRIFHMPKFRTMYVDTPSVATHLLAKADSHVTPVGKLLRKTSLDELPQLWSVLKGDMSVVGPRPALFNQHDLLASQVGHR